MNDDIKSAGSDHGVECSAPTFRSNSLVILAADAALAAVGECFKKQIEENYWEAVKYQRAALEAALASLVS